MTEFDFTKVAKPKPKPADPDWSNPVSFFYKLSHPAIKDLFPVQSDLLKNWYAAMKAGANDKMVSMNTGAGKTLVGLMIAESIRRETGGKVVYVCPNNFLGKQTVDEANKYGIRVVSYLRLGSESPMWSDEVGFLENNAICVTTYAALLNPRSVFRPLEIRGVIFDDAHLSLNLLDDQFSIRSADVSLIKGISEVFKSSPHIREKIISLQTGDPLSLVMIPPLEWHQQTETIKGILSNNKKVSESLTWLNLKENLDRTFCFISARGIEIGFIYPDTKRLIVFHESVHRVYLSATLPNLDDLTRVFGITPSRIEVDNPDYRPQRLFVFAKKTKIEDPESVIRENLQSISPKTLVLAPSNELLTPYRAMGALTPANSDEVPEKIKQFKDAPTGILALANRYDGIDMPGETCHSLSIDGLPYTGTLKTRFFSEYFHNHKNSFLRSIIASKLVQAFGRTIRANNDYSIIFLLGEKLNSWVINKDNKKFFKRDLYEDIEIGLSISESIYNLGELKNLAREILGQTDNWKRFIEDRKSDVASVGSFSKEEEEKNIQIAQKERRIHDAFVAGKYRDCLDLILTFQKELAEYSKPLLGLYLSIAVICCFKTNDPRIADLSSRAYGINPIFGAPVVLAGQARTMQAQRIIDYEKVMPELDWSITGPMFDENLKKLGELLGFSSRRPEAEGEGTLDVCWEDEENRVVLGFENKIGKTNGILTKGEIDQCSGHTNWMEENYPGYEMRLFAVGEFEGYNKKSSPADLLHISPDILKKIVGEIEQIHAKKSLPEQVDSLIDSFHLRINELFPIRKVSTLPRVVQ
jgi:hypothetical protein